MYYIKQNNRFVSVGDNLNIVKAKATKAGLNEVFVINRMLFTPVAVKTGGKWGI